ncbi:MAG: 50S ribosomal protein L9 [Rickettsiales bacterium]|jgi:large subunit ribosomal protein L9|nr:50S ribosomal protein L9 [Rickettsiales bacterium]
MRVILKNKVKKLGNIGDIVDVKDGYGRNYLIPCGFALFYTDKNYEYFKQKKEELEKENNENKIKAEELKNKIKNIDIVLIENSGDDGKLYGSITNVKIAKFINSLLKTDFKKSVFSTNEIIKEVGKYSVNVELHPEVSFEKDIIIARSKEEAIKIKKGENVVRNDEKKAIEPDSNEITKQQEAEV